MVDPAPEGDPEEREVVLSVVEPAPKPTPVGVGAEGGSGSDEDDAGESDGSGTEPAAPDAPADSAE
jgi:hypothetical protein